MYFLSRQQKDEESYDDHNHSSTVPGEWDRRLTSRAERYAAGKALRSKAPRSSHADGRQTPNAQTL